MKERPIIFSVTTGRPSQRGKRLKAADGLTWKQRTPEPVMQAMLCLRRHRGRVLERAPLPASFTRFLIGQKN